MDPSEAPERVSANDADLEAAVGLAAEAGWNQIADDWRLFVDAGSVFGFRDSDGRLIATAAAIPYGSDFGWISMVLVTGAWQRKGLATRLLQACIAALENAGLTPALDATPDGEKVYVRLGFSPQLDLQRWQRGAAGPRTPGIAGEGIRTATSHDADAIAARDAGIFGGDRSVVIRHLLNRRDARGWVLADGRGYLLSRRGRLARQLGPLCAENEDDAVRLVAAAVAEIDGPIFIDVPDRHAALIDFLRDNGFTSQRPFRRMAKGRSMPFGDPDHVFALVGPEFG